MIDLTNLKDESLAITDLWDALHAIRSEIARREVVENSAVLAQEAQDAFNEKLNLIATDFQANRGLGDEWIQPVPGSPGHDAYPLSWEVEWLGKRWKSRIPNNVTTPGNPDDPQSYRWWEDLTPVAEPPAGEHPYWLRTGVAYAVDAKVQDEGVDYVCRLAHTSQPDWAPADTPAMWQVIPADPPAGGGVPEWEQRWASPYWPAGSVVTWEGKTWENTSGGDNSYEPGVYGWTART